MISWATCLRSNPSKVDLGWRLSAEVQDLPAGPSRQLPAGKLCVADRLLPLRAKQHRNGLEKRTANLLLAFLQPYAVPLGADLAALWGSIAPVGPVLPIPDLSQFWGTFLNRPLAGQQLWATLRWHCSAKLICPQTGGENPRVGESRRIRHISKPRVYKAPPVICLPPNPPALPPPGLSPGKRNGVTTSGGRRGTRRG